MTSIILTLRGHLLAWETCYLSHKMWKLLQRFDLGTCPKKKDRTGQSKKTQRCYISPTLEKSPLNWFAPKLHSSCCPHHNHVYKVSNWNFQGLWFYKDHIFWFSIDSCMGLTTVERYCAAYGCRVLIVNLCTAVIMDHE